MGRFFLFLAALLLTVATLPTPRVYATTVPNFPNCINPQGDMKVQYQTGVHGVPGDLTTYTGQDTVYTVNETQTTQCLCVDNGQGIQTNWWKISDLTDSELQVLKNDGWIYIPDGSLWGLDQGPYLAKNMSYTCRGTGGGDGGTGGGNNDGGGSSSSSNGGTGGGSIAGATTAVLAALANTGNVGLLYFFFGLSIFSGILTVKTKKSK